MDWINSLAGQDSLQAKVLQLLSFLPGKLGVHGTHACSWDGQQRAGKRRAVVSSHVTWCHSAPCHLCQILQLNLGHPTISRHGRGQLCIFPELWKYAWRRGQKLNFQRLDDICGKRATRRERTQHAKCIKLHAPETRCNWTWWTGQ